MHGAHGMRPKPFTSVLTPRLPSSSLLSLRRQTLYIIFYLADTQMDGWIEGVSGEKVRTSSLYCLNENGGKGRRKELKQSKGMRRYLGNEGTWT